MSWSELETVYWIEQGFLIIFFSFFQLPCIIARHKRKRFEKVKEDDEEIGKESSKKIKVTDIYYFLILFALVFQTLARIFIKNAAIDELKIKNEAHFGAYLWGSYMLIISWIPLFPFSYILYNWGVGKQLKKVPGMNEEVFTKKEVSLNNYALLSLALMLVVLLLHVASFITLLFYNLHTFWLLGSIVCFGVVFFSLAVSCNDENLLNFF